MRLLILGGTAFLGRAVARQAHSTGHEVTCVARGTSGAPVDGVRFIVGDREQADGLSGLAGERFDAVVDVTRRPSHAQRAVRELAEHVDHWVYVSSISVYADQATPGQRADTAPLVPPPPPGVDNPTGEHAQYYGSCKLACEQVVREQVGADRSVNCRAGLIIGPEDPTGRFSYWVARLDRGGEVLAPGDPKRPVQVVDVRDLADWLIRAAEQRLTGSYDAACPPLPMRELLAAVAAGVGTAPTLRWVDQEFLLAQQVAPWAGARSLPLWLPTPEYAGMLAHDVRPVLAAGLRIRPIPQTTADTLDWLRSQCDPAVTGLAAAGITAADEAALLRAWDAHLDPAQAVRS